MYVYVAHRKRIDEEKVTTVGLVNYYHQNMVIENYVHVLLAKSHMNITTYFLL